MSKFIEDNKLSPVEAMEAGLKEAKYLIKYAVSCAGTFDPDIVLDYVMEKLTLDEYKEAEAFLTWIHENNLTFGHNFDSMYLQFKLQA